VSSFEIDEIVVRVLRLPLKEPFTTSSWTTPHKTPIVVELKGQGLSGWGEAAVPLFPFYNHESPQTVLHILKDFAIPIFSKERPESPQEANKALKRIQRNGFARGVLEMAYWDWSAKKAGLPLYRFLGGERSEIPVGVSIGIQKDATKLVSKVAEYLESGYQRIKIKIAPGNDLDPVKILFREFPEIPLMVDANSAYTLATSGVFEEMDAYPLLMIEQPLHETDIYQHSLLQKKLRIPICLDESIESLWDAEAAISMGSCKILNIKPGRVGGLSEAVAIHRYCSKKSIPVWCGGMLESGIGRAANMALATLPNFTFPGDISESKRYYHEDIVAPEIVLQKGGVLKLPDGPGIGFAVLSDALDRVTISKEVIKV
jgi:O-succinylbenzoate synthase